MVVRKQSVFNVRRVDTKTKSLHKHFIDTFQACSKPSFVAVKQERRAGIYKETCQPSAYKCKVFAGKPQPYVDIEPASAKLMAPRCGLGPAGLIIPRQQAMMYGYSGPGLSPDHL